MRLQGKTVGIFVAQEVEDLEFWVPVMRLREEGAKVIVIGLSTQTVHGKHGLEMTPDVSIDEAPGADELDGVVIPGGWAPDKLRRSQKLLQLVRDMDAQGKLVAAICHGPWVLCSAGGMLRKRKATSFFAIKDDVINAGGKYVDAEVVRDGNLITSRKPDDLPAFMQAIIQAVKEVQPAMASR